MGRRLLGNTYLQQGRYDDAITTLKSLAADLPGDFDAQFLLGILHYRIGAFSKAIPYYEAALRLSPRHITVITDLQAARTWSHIERIPFLRRLIMRSIPAIRALPPKQRAMILRK